MAFAWTDRLACKNAWYTYACMHTRIRRLPLLIYAGLNPDYFTQFAHPKTRYCT